jgi:hypothetical protein
MLGLREVAVWILLPMGALAQSQIPAPGAKEWASILAAIAENALRYTDGLPNFVCTQVTRRHRDPTGTESWILEDTLQEQLSYMDHREEYAGAGHAQPGGAKSAGEFGSMLYEIFQPETHTRFDWERWATLRGRRMYVFAFRVKQANSRYSIYHQGSNRTIVTGYHGLIYADRDTKMVLRVRLECDGIPADFPVQQISEVLDYDFVSIADRQYVLPLKADMHSRETPHNLVWNEIEFRSYRRFAADASINFEPSFDAPDPIPEDRLREQPAR